MCNISHAAPTKSAHSRLSEPTHPDNSIQQRCARILKVLTNPKHILRPPCEAGAKLYYFQSGTPSRPSAENLRPSAYRKEHKHNSNNKQASQRQTTLQNSRICSITSPTCVCVCSVQTQNRLRFMYILCAVHSPSGWTTTHCHCRIIRRVQNQIRC